MGFALTLRLAVFFLGTCVFTQSASISKKTSQLLDGGDIHLVGDIMYNEEDYNRKFGNGMRSSRAVIVKAQNLLWTNGTIYYDYAKDPGQDGKYKIERAMREWEKYTCIRFIRGKPADGYLNIITDKGICASFVGRKRAKIQGLYLAYPGCFSHRIILHELGHAIGLFHEHTHPYRDNYVTINWPKIKDGMKLNFNIRSNETTCLKVSYDPYSIMHYSAYAFSKDGNITIETKDPALQDIIGNAKHLSSGDIKTVNLRYKCNECKRLVCKNGGSFDDPSCSCNCVGYYTGKKCECKRLLCKNGGSFDDSSCSCKCVGDYTGKNCECKKKIDCKYGGRFNELTCSCDCFGHYTGKNCDECSDKNVRSGCFPGTNLQVVCYKFFTNCPKIRVLGL